MLADMLLSCQEVVLTQLLTGSACPPIFQVYVRTSSLNQNSWNLIVHTFSKQQFHNPRAALTADSIAGRSASGTARLPRDPGLIWPEFQPNRTTPSACFCNENPLSRPGVARDRSSPIALPKLARLRVSTARHSFGVFWLRFRFARTNIGMTIIARTNPPTTIGEIRASPTVLSIGTSPTVPLTANIHPSTADPQAIATHKFGEQRRFIALLLFVRRCRSRLRLQSQCKRCHQGRRSTPLAQSMTTSSTKHPMQYSSFLLRRIEHRQRTSNLNMGRLE